MEEVNWSQISCEVAAFYPEYASGVGDVTRFIMADGEQRIVHRSIRAALLGLTRSFAVDLQRIRQIYGKSVGQRNGIPLPLTAKLVLVPIKVRKPRMIKDGTCGYLNYHQYQKVESWREGDYRSRIILQNGYVLPCTVSTAAVEKQIRNARLVYSEYLRRQGNEAALAPVNSLSNAEIGQLVRGMLMLCRNLDDTTSALALVREKPLP